MNLNSTIEEVDKNYKNLIKNHKYYNNWKISYNSNYNEYKTKNKTYYLSFKNLLQNIDYKVMCYVFKDDKNGLKYKLILANKIKYNSDLLNSDNIIDNLVKSKINIPFQIKSFCINMKYEFDISKINDKNIDLKNVINNYINFVNNTGDITVDNCQIFYTHRFDNIFYEKRDKCYICSGYKVFNLNKSINNEVTLISFENLKVFNKVNINLDNISINNNDKYLTYNSEYYYYYYLPNSNVNKYNNTYLTFTNYISDDNSNTTMNYNICVNYDILCNYNNDINIYNNLNKEFYNNIDSKSKLFEFNNNTFLPEYMSTSYSISILAMSVKLDIELDDLSLNIIKEHILENNNTKEVEYILKFNAKLTKRFNDISDNNTIYLEPIYYCYIIITPIDELNYSYNSFLDCSSKICILLKFENNYKKITNYVDHDTIIVDTFNKFTIDNNIFFNMYGYCRSSLPFDYNSISEIKFLDNIMFK